MDAAIVVARIVQFLGAAALFGTPLCLLLAPEPSPSARAEAGARRLAAGGAAALFIGALAYLLAQTASMAGDPRAALDPETLRSVLLESAMGLAVLARSAAAVVGLALATALRPARPLWLGLAALGCVALLSSAWTGHGAADEGARGLLHLAADLAHLFGAGVWLGALFAFALMLANPSAVTEADAKALHRALAGFGRIGSAAVAVIVASGLVNSWFLVGATRIARLFDTPYGLVLTAKLIAFAAMVALATRNRFAHTPALGRALAAGELAGPSLSALKRSVLLETLLGGLVVALVSVLGMLEPISSQ